MELPIKGKLKLYFAFLKLCKKTGNYLGINFEKKVLINCIAIFHYHHIRPLVDELIKEKKVKIFFLENNNFRPSLLPNELLDKSKFISASRARFIMFDMTISLDYRSHWIPHPGIHMLVPHGDGMKDSYSGSNELLEFDVVFALSKRMATLQQKYIREDAVVEKIGFIVSEYNQTVKKEINQSNIKFKNKLPIVLYAPSWSIAPSNIMITENLLEKLSNQKEYNIIVKPHPRLFIPEACGGKDWLSILRTNLNERFYLVEDTTKPIQIYMAESDAILSDISSVIYEYLYFDKPIIIHINKDVIKYYKGENALQQIQNAAFLFNHDEDIINAIKSALDQNFLHSLERKSILERQYYNIGRATETAKKVIYKHLSLMS